MQKRLLEQASLILFGLAFGFLFQACDRGIADPPAPYGVLPSPQQVEWQKMEYYMFIHFGVNTFTDKEWGDGKEHPEVFNPSDLDCRQWAATAKAAGMKAIIITAKHHDGFCLWPSNYSTHTVRESPWKEGQGDVLKELSEACAEYGLKFGVYLSPWDQNHPAYGSETYNQVFANTLSEVLGNYGDVFEQWFDGASDGASDGKLKQPYDWDLFHETVFRHQPQAIIFSDVGPGCRWMGNERGIAGETNWSRLDTEGFGPGRAAPPQDTLSQGNRYGANWVPAETDVSIRPGWFYRTSEDSRVKTVDHLLDIYYTSVGRNSNLLLNVPPDPRGRINEIDSVRLMEFKDKRENEFKQNLADNATIKASKTRGSNYSAANLLDDDYDTYWTTRDETLTASLEIDLKSAQAVNRILLQEYIPLGQRVARFNVEYLGEGNEWHEAVSATTIGYKRILRFPTVKAQKLRINIQESLACPVLSKVAVYKADERLTPPIITRSSDGMVSIRCESPDPIIYYAANPAEINEEFQQYKGPFPLTEGIVKAYSRVNNESKDRSELVIADFDYNPVKWKVVLPEAPNTRAAIDGNPQTRTVFEQSQALIVKLGDELTLKGFTYTPVNNTIASHIQDYDFLISQDGTTWQSVQKGSFDNIQNNPIKQTITLAAPVKAKYIQLKPVRITGKDGRYFVQDVGIVTK